MRLRHWCPCDNGGVTTSPRPSARTISLSFLTDLILVVLFAALGRASHDSEPFGIGLIGTAWPFVVALMIAWAASFVLRKPTAVVPTGLIVWVVTVAGGLGIRVLSGDTAAVPFIIVATITLAVSLLGWRLIALLVAKRRGA